MVASRLPRWAYPAVTAASLALGVVIIVRGTSAFAIPADSDLQNYFFKSVDHVIHGDAGHMYAARGDVPVDDNPNDDPPLQIFLMAPLLALARAAGLSFRGEIILVSIPFIVVVPLLGWLVLRVVANLNPTLREPQRLLTYALVTLSPLVWLCYSPWGHLEQPMMLCFLIAAMLALQARREVLAGLLVGATLLTGLTALTSLLAIAVLLLASGEVRTVVRVGVIGALVVAVGMAPFLLADRHDTLYSLLTWRPSRAIGGNSIWVLVNADHPQSFNSLVRRLDSPTILLGSAALGYLAATRLRITAFGSAAWAVLGTAAILFPMLTKVNWPYYYTAPYILLLAWEVASLRPRSEDSVRWPAISVCYLLVTATLSQYIGLRSIAVGDRVITGVFEFLSMAAFAGLVLYVLHRESAATVDSHKAASV